MKKSLTAIAAACSIGVTSVALGLETEPILGKSTQSTKAISGQGGKMIGSDRIAATNGKSVKSNKAIPTQEWKTQGKTKPASKGNQFPGQDWRGGKKPVS